jgi:iron complex outermembrane receptor protein
VSWFEWQTSLTIGHSWIPDYTDWVSIYDENWEEIRQDEINFGTVTTAFSPDVTFSNMFTFSYAGLRADIQTIAVSKQYLDNTKSEEAVLKPYTVTNLTVQYSLPLPKKWPDISLIAQVNNLFDSKYESNGGNWMCQFEDGSRYYSPWYYAQAGINVHGGIRVQW